MKKQSLGLIPLLLIGTVLVFLTSGVLGANPRAKEGDLVLLPPQTGTRLPRLVPRRLARAMADPKLATKRARSKPKPKKAAASKADEEILLRGGFR